MVKEILGGDVKKNLSEDLYTREDDFQGYQQIVQPVIIGNKNRCNIVKLGTATATLYTTPTDKDFYLTDLSLGCTSDGGGLLGNTSNRISFTPQGDAGKNFIVGISTNSDNTGAHNNQNMSFQNGILLERGSTIVLTINSDTGLGVIAGFVLSRQDRRI